DQDARWAVRCAGPAAAAAPARGQTAVDVDDAAVDTTAAAQHSVRHLAVCRPARYRPARANRLAARDVAYARAAVFGCRADLANLTAERRRAANAARAEARTAVGRRHACVAERMAAARSVERNALTARARLAAAVSIDGARPVVARAHAADLADTGRADARTA